MGTSSSLACLLLVFAVGTWSRSADTDHVESNSFRYGGWRPIRGRSLYARNNSSNIHSHSRQNLYVVVPTALINLGHPPVNQQSVNNELTEESQVREQRVRFPEPHPDAEPSPNLALLRPKHHGIPLRSEHEHVEESQNREVYQQSVARPLFQGPVPMVEPEASIIHSPHLQDPRNYQTHAPVRHPQHLEAEGQLKPKRIPPPTFKYGQGLVRGNRIVEKQKLRTFGATYNFETEPAELEAQGTRQFGIRIRYQTKEEIRKGAGQQPLKESLQINSNSEQLLSKPPNSDRLVQHHLVAYNEKGHQELHSKITQQERPGSIPQTGVPNKIPEEIQDTYIIAKHKIPNNSSEQNRVLHFSSPQDLSVKISYEISTAKSQLQHHVLPTRSPILLTTSNQPQQYHPVIPTPLPFDIQLNQESLPNIPKIASSKDNTIELKENGPIYKKPIEFSRGATHESLHFDKFLQATNANRVVNQPLHKLFPPSVSGSIPPQQSQTVFEQTVKSQIQFQEEKQKVGRDSAYFPGAQNLTNIIHSENALKHTSEETYFPPLLPSASRPTIITNDLFGQPLIIPSSHHLAQKTTTSITCNLRCVPNILNFDKIAHDFTLKKKMERYLAGALFQIVPLQEESLIKFISAGGPYTLFLPSDEAIARFPHQIIERWQRNPQSLMFTLLNHAIPTKETLDKLRQKKVVHSKAAGAILYVNDYRNETVTVNGKRLVHANIRGPQNGILHIIDGMLLPAAEKDIVSVLKVCNRFEGFLDLAERSGVVSLLRRDGPYTLFLPSNDALMKIEKDDMDFMRSNITTMKEFLLYHIVEGLYYSGDLLDGQYLRTLYPGYSVKAGIRVDGCYRRLVEANNSPVYRADIPAKNGVIHVIDWVIRPTDLDWCDGILLP